MKVVAMIPARLESSRLPGKALIDIHGLPMVIHTCKRAMLARNVDAVYLATDNQFIKETAEQHGINVIMTKPTHQTGSDRIAEAIEKVPSDIVINVQGDEPLLNPEHLERIIEEIKGDESVQCALGVTPYSEKNRGSDIKAVLDLNNNVMYCSRTDLPSDARRAVNTMLKMVFLVAFRTPFLRQYAAWNPTPLETIEYNEYLRILEHGERIRAVHLSAAKISVDTHEDLEIIRAHMKADTIRLRYMNE